MEDIQIDPSQINPEQRKEISRKLVRIPAVVVLVGVAIAAAVYGGIWFWQKQHTYPFAIGLETYRNTEYGFEIQYPSQWVVEQDQSLILALASKDTGGIYKEGNIYVGIRYISDWNQEPTDAINTNISREYELYTLRAKLNTDIRINFVGDSPWGTTAVYIKKPHTNEGFAISAAIDNSDYPEYGGHNANKVLFKQILSTFKFIDETADWQIYSNQKLGIEFKFPQDWEVADTEGICVEAIGKRYMVEESEACGINISVSFNVPESALNIDKIIELKKLNSPHYKESHITVGGTDAIRVTGFADDTYIKHGNAEVIINSIFADNPNYPEIKPALNGIISTFKFIDPTVDWKVYTHPKYGFEFKYPKVWVVENFDQGDYRNLSLEVINPAYPDVPDTDVPAERFFIYLVKLCQEEPWHIGFAELEYKTACIKYGDSYFKFQLNPIYPDSKLIMEQMLSTFKL